MDKVFQDFSVFAYVGYALYEVIPYQAREPFDKNALCFFLCSW
jgi:hypothetical protein